MPQITNFNTFPYFDDFNSDDSYYKVLFKPGYPVQARELTTLQSILQNQIEKFGTHVFKEGSAVIPGRFSISNGFYGIRLEANYLGLSVENYTKFLIGKTITGQKTNVKARIEYIDESDNRLLYVTYLNSSPENVTLLSSGEVVTVDQQVPITESGITTLNAGQGIGVIEESTVGTAVFVSSGVFFLKGHFVQVEPQYHVINSRFPNESAKIGFLVQEEIVTAEDDASLFDNSQGFENYSAPGADRFKIVAKLSSVALNEEQLPENFVELMRIRNGQVISENTTNPEYNILANEFARRTYDESGDYYVKPFTLDIRESLNDRKGNDGLYFENDITDSGNLSRDSLGVYKISSGKAYVRGFEVEVPSPVNIDFEKPRTTKLLKDESISYFTGPTFTLNRVYGRPTIGISTNYTVSLRDQRVGSIGTASSGDEIGIARVYDFALESGSYDSAFPDFNQWDISLYDLQLYTKIVVNENISTLKVPTLIKGKSSGSTGFLRSDVTNSNTLTVYSVNGKFIFGEKLLFDGLESNRVITSVTEYGVNDVKSLYSSQDQYFSADTVQYTSSNVGNVSITARHNPTGVCTVTKVDYDFSTKFKVNSLVTFSVSGSSLKNIARVSQVSRSSLQIVGLTTVSGVYEGSLYTSTQTPQDFSLVNSKLQSSSDNTFYTNLPKRFVSSVDLTDSYLTIRKVFNVNIVSGSITIAPQDLEENETFLPFDEERYILSRADGTKEILTTDKFNLLSGGKELVINGLGSNSSATLVATMRKIKIKSKNKFKNRVKIITVDKSKYEESGIGATTKNDGLTYGNYPYGTRVQDEDICLLYPDVTKIHGIYESNTLGDPELPSLSITNIISLNTSAFDTLIGEELIGESSGALAIVLQHRDSRTISISYLNEQKFNNGETLRFLESDITCSLSSYSDGDRDITSSYTLDSAQSSTSYNYSKIVRKNISQEPSKRLKIAFEYASIPSSDTGDILTVDSYNQFDYCDLSTINGIKVSDIIDIRPRVAPYTVQENARSPFEFLGKSFVSTENQNTDILAPDESILLDYSIYLPRIDRIFLSKDNRIIVQYGTPSETPEIPDAIEDSLEIAKITLPAYLCDVSEAKISLVKHKRYRMSDIALLEDRVKNLEYYTSLSLLETNTSNLTIKDDSGLERFKSGFFVDNFTNTISQEKLTSPKNSIDIRNNELRPSSYTTELDLVLGATSLTGVGGPKNPNQDPRFATDLTGNNIRRSTTDPFSDTVADGMGVLTLDHDETLWITQTSATRVENITPYMVTFYVGDITLSPSSDIWVDQVRVQTNTIDGLLGGFSETEVQLNARDVDPQLGWSPILWNAWEDNWTGTTVTDRVDRTSTTTTIPGTGFQTDGYRTETTDTTIRTTTRTGTSNRSGSAKQIAYTPGNTYNLGDRILSVDVAPFLRSRNVEFIARRMKPQTLLIPTFDKLVVSQFVVPKLLEVEIISGSFIVGETVIGGVLNSLTNNSPYIRFRVASLNHRNGPFNRPTDIFETNPYTRENLPASYDSTTTILNVDISSLSLQSETNFFGFVSPEMVLVGQTSGSRAVIKSVRLVTDETGTVIGSFFIPNPNAASAPRFNAGNIDFALRSAGSLNPDIPGSQSTSAKATYFSTGSITPVQGTIISTRNVEVRTADIDESRNISDTTTSIVDVKTTIDLVLPQPVPSPQPQPIPLPVPIPVPQPVPVPQPAPTPNPVPRPAPAGVTPTPNPVPRPVGVTPTPQPRAPIPAPVQPPVPRPNPPVPVPQPQCNNVPRDECQPRIFRRPVPIVQSIAQGGDRWEQRRERVQNANGCFVCRDRGEPQFLDPIAQSFRAPEKGCFITAIDLFFAEKDTDNTSIFVELRPMTLGLPEANAYPMSRKVIFGKDIRTSNDASVATRVSFDAPIYLEGGREHAVVIGSASNKYLVWISRLGEVDVRTSNQLESSQRPVTSQSQLGSFFKSQNATTWTPSQYEDLTFNLYIAEFAPEGVVSFFSPDVRNSILRKDPISLSSNKVRVGLGTTINSFDQITPGNTVIQEGSNAVGNYIGGAGICTGSLNVINSGIGYTPFSGSFSFTNIPLIAVTGSGENAVANISVTNGSITSASIVAGGNGYVIGDVLTADSIGNTNLGRNLELSVSNIIGVNEIIVDQVQGTFEVGAGKTVKFINSVGVTTVFSRNSQVVVSAPPRVISDGLHMKVIHFNHGMHSSTNTVTLSNIRSDFSPSTLSVEYAVGGTNEIRLVSATGYDRFENIAVSPTNPGYLLIDDEIISYTSVSGNILSGLTRGIDSTIQVTHSVGTIAYKYELNGISLRRINKNHDLQDVTINPEEGRIGLDHYYIKIDTSSNGRDRSEDDGVVPALKFNETKSVGGDIVRASNNIQFEIMKPIIQTLVLPSTQIIPRVRTVSATSISGNEVSFLDNGYQSISLQQNNYFDSPRMIASRVNESGKLVNLPGNKSFEIELTLRTQDAYLSPVIDLDRIGAVFISNRVNSVITDYINDSRVSTLKDDPTAFVYATKPIELEIPAISIKSIVSAYVNQNSDVRAFFAVTNDPTNLTNMVYYPFPGYTNRIESGEIIDISDNDGTPDSKVPKVNNYGFGSNDLVFRDYEFTIDNLSPFKYFSIKLVGTSTNQCYPPRFRDFRVVAYT